MSAEENKAIVRRGFEAIPNQGNLYGVGEFFVPDFIDH
jgi:hypothetical protein